MGPRGFGERLQNALENLTRPRQKQPSEQEAVAAALEVLGSGELGKALADCEQDRKEQGKPTEQHLLTLKSHYEEVYRRWGHQRKWPVHDGHRENMDILLRECAQMLGPYGYLEE